mmetsp:Transcript_39654/g.107217  ORF Transcript_39654/g.107217 Transcript_39654/m.107217 type:complete len:439 (-) Transcript_39654:271-1587(-)|eukprot:CAMPEP_0171200286 /NCGR_PEP_ID=MMETSP0790-20130122/23902_1 /TAXON_ID=2925 /ORGANISM="Alexandrium catenella, Strain OF101" /LENGTH=438 /DNA_ID=CAMNT_0011665661 /DNA_START=100 /DNA_END=1416 /DNA_ORIENTATION=+
MGNGPSEEVDPSFPTTGKPMVVRVQCSHNGQRVDVTGCQGYSVTSDWTAADLAEAIEQEIGVHRKCQTLMFAGREMKPRCTLLDLIGTQLAQLPSRVTIFLIVNREVFPQKLGPFSMVSAPFEPEDFMLPEFTENLRANFYWEMKTGILEGYGLRASATLISGQVSPLHPVHDDLAWRQAVGMPSEAEEFAWSYPVAKWERVESDVYAMDNWDSLPTMEHSAALKSFLTVGGFLFFNGRGRIVGATTPGRPSKDDPTGLSFGDPERWRSEWTQSLAEQGRFQDVTMKLIVSLGARKFCWLRPNEVIEDGDGQPLPFQPKVPYGGLVYLFHEDIMSTDRTDAALDRYFPVALGANGSEVELTSACLGQPDGALFRAFSLVEETKDLHGDPVQEFVGQSFAPAPCPEEDSDADIPDESSARQYPPECQVIPSISLSGKNR